MYAFIFYICVCLSALLLLLLLSYISCIILLLLNISKGSDFHVLVCAVFLWKVPGCCRILCRVSFNGSTSRSMLYHNETLISNRAAKKNARLVSFGFVMRACFAALFNFQQCDGNQINLNCFFGSEKLKVESLFVIAFCFVFILLAFVFQVISGNK